MTRPPIARRRCASTAPPGAVGYPASKKPEAWKVFAISRVHKQPFELFESEACVARSMPTRA